MQKLWKKISGVLKNIIIYKNHSIFNPYVLECQGKLVEVFYVPAVNEQTKLNLSDHGSYQISGNNCDGFIITSWRLYV